MDFAWNWAWLVLLNIYPEGPHCPHYFERLASLGQSSFELHHGKEEGNVVQVIGEVLSGWDLLGIARNANDRSFILANPCIKCMLWRTKQWVFMLLLLICVT